MAGVTLKNITKRWGAITGVDNQSLEIHDREFLVLPQPDGPSRTRNSRSAMVRSKLSTPTKEPHRLPTLRS